MAKRARPEDGSEEDSSSSEEPENRKRARIQVSHVIEHFLEFPEDIQNLIIDVVLMDPGFKEGESNNKSVLSTLGLTNASLAARVRAHLGQRFRILLESMKHDFYGPVVDIPKIRAIASTWVDFVKRTRLHPSVLILTYLDREKEFPPLTKEETMQLFTGPGATTELLKLRGDIMLEVLRERTKDTRPEGEIGIALKNFLVENHMGPAGQMHYVHHVMFILSQEITNRDQRLELLNRCMNLWMSKNTKQAFIVGGLLCANNNNTERESSFWRNVVQHVCFRLESGVLKTPPLVRVAMGYLSTYIYPGKLSSYITDGMDTLQYFVLHGRKIKKKGVLLKERNQEGMLDCLIPDLAMYATIILEPQGVLLPNIRRVTGDVRLFFENLRDRHYKKIVEMGGVPSNQRPWNDVLMHPKDVLPINLPLYWDAIKALDTMPAFAFLQSDELRFLIRKYCMRSLFPGQDLAKQDDLDRYFPRDQSWAETRDLLSYIGYLTYVQTRALFHHVSRMIHYNSVDIYNVVSRFDTNRVIFPEEALLSSDDDEEFDE